MKPWELWARLLSLGRLHVLLATCLAAQLGPLVVGLSAASVVEGYTAMQ